MKPGTGASLTDEYKQRVIRRALAIIKSGYTKHQAEKLIKHDINHVELWANQLGIEWPEKHKRKKKEVKL